MLITTISLDEATRKKLDNYCKNLAIGRSSAIRILINKFIKTEGI